MIEAFKHAYAVRMGLADPAFVNITSVLEDMLNPDIAAELQKLISDNTTFPSGYYGGRLIGFFLFPFLSKVKSKSSKCRCAYAYIVFGLDVNESCGKVLSSLNAC
jgi:hypothetical protein